MLLLTDALLLQPLLPFQETNTYKKSSAALLGGSVYSLLLLSKEPKIKALGVQVAFAGLRMALAATQTNNFADCLDNDNPPAVDTAGLTKGLYTGELFRALQDVPILSGPFGPFTAATPLQLGPDGTRVICASIAMMSGTGTWQSGLMWQGAADITNALYQTILDTGLLSTTQRQELCGATRAIYTFIKTNALGQPIGPPVIAAPAIPPITGTEFDWSCSTTQATCSGGPGWLANFNANKLQWQLALGNDFTPGSPDPLKSGSPFTRVCYAAFK
jgi:hypothetical protein